MGQGNGECMVCRNGWRIGDVLAIACDMCGTAHAETEILSNFVGMMKKFALPILALFLASTGLAQKAPDSFDPSADTVFTTHRADGRYVSTRAIAHHLMRAAPPALRFDSTLNRTGLRAWQQQVREEMARLMCHPKIAGLPAPRKVAEWQRDGYRVEKWEAYPLPQAAVPYLVLVPDGVGADSPAPALLCIPGSGQTKELLAGEPQLHDADQAFRPAERAMARLYARQGYVAVVVDNPGAGEAEDLEGKAGTGGYDYVTVARALLELGWSYLGYASYVDKHVLDWMKTRPDVRADRIVVSGFSLGTEPLMVLGVLDSSIYAFVYNDFLCTTRERALVMTRPDARGRRPWPNDISHLIPRFLCQFDFPDLVAALAPRPVICTEGGMDRDFDAVRRAYAIAGAPENFTSYHYAKFQDPAARVRLSAMPEGIDRATFFRLANVDPPRHYFKAEYVLPWLEKVLAE